MRQIGWNDDRVALGGNALIPDEAPNQVIQAANAVIERAVQSRVRRFLNESQFEYPVQEQNFGPFSQTNPFTVSDSQSNLLGGVGVRDFTNRQQDELSRQVYFLYMTNPHVKAALDFNTDFVVGEGFSFESPNEDLMRVLKEFWTDPDSNWEVRQENKVRELSLYGEQAWPVKVNPVTGRVKIGYIDPARIHDVTFEKGNTEVQDTVWVRTTEFGGEPFPMKIIRENPETGLLEGDIFYFSVNRVSNAKRGTSDVLASLDWFDIYDQFIFAFTERYLLQQSYVWDVEWKGLTDEEIQAKSEKLKKAPKPGAVRHHNDKVSWQVLAPKPGQGKDAQNVAELLRNYALTGVRMPEWALVEGGEVNFATAKAMGTPLFKRLVRRQNMWTSIIDFVFRYVAEQAVGHGEISQADMDAGWTVEGTEISTEDTETASSTLVDLSTTLIAAQKSGWISQDQAGEVYTREATNLGIEMENEELPERDLSVQPPDTGEEPNDADLELMDLFSRQKESYESELAKVG